MTSVAFKCPRHGTDLNTAGQCQTCLNESYQLPKEFIPPTCPTCGQKVTLKAELKKAGREGEYEKVKKERQRK